MYLIIITGMPASGKSTLAAAAENAFGWPVLEKDRLKERLFDTVGFADHAEKDALDVRANAELLSLLEGSLQRGENVIVDNNFDDLSAGKLEQLLARYSPATAVVELAGDPEVFYQRYVARDGAARRHIGHALQDHYPLRPGETFRFSMSYEEYRHIFIDRGMDRADWAPDRLSFDASQGDLPVAEILGAVRGKLGLPVAAESVSDASVPEISPASDPDARPLVAFPFRSFPALVGGKTARALENEGFRVAANLTGRKLTGEELREFVKDAFAIVAGSERYGGDLIRSAKNLRLIVRFGVGLDNFDLDAIRECGIQLAVIRNDQAVAEHTLMLMLSVLRMEPRRDREIRAGIWSHTPLRELRGKTVGLLGFGRIGQQVAELLQSFHVTILAADPFFNREAGERLHVTEVCFEELLRKSDILSLHLPDRKENENLLNEDTFSQMKPGAFFINTARGKLVDENALVKALESGRLAGAALDAFRTEPLPPDSPLLSAPNLVLSPHTAALTVETNEEACRTVVSSILKVRNGGEPDYPVRLAP